MTTLLPCPFDHDAMRRRFGHPVTQEIEIEEKALIGDDPVYFAICRGCGAQGPLSESAEVAAEEWNGRAVLAERLESERLLFELARCVGEANLKLQALADRTGVPLAPLQLVASEALSGADGPIDPGPLARLLSALVRYDVVAATDGEDNSGALAELIDAGRAAVAAYGWAR